MENMEVGSGGAGVGDEPPRPAAAAAEIVRAGEVAPESMGSVGPPPGAHDDRAEVPFPGWLVERLKMAGLPGTRAGLRALISALLTIPEDAPDQVGPLAMPQTRPGGVSPLTDRRVGGGDRDPSRNLVLRAVEESARLVETLGAEIAGLKTQLAGLTAQVAKVPLETAELIKHVGLEAVDGDGGGLGDVEERPFPPGGPRPAAPGAARKETLRALKERLDEARMDPLWDRLARDARGNASKMKMQGPAMDAALQTVDLTDPRAVRQAVMGLVCKRLQDGGMAPSRYKEFQDDNRTTFAVAKGNTAATANRFYVTVGFADADRRQWLWGFRQMVVGPDRAVQLGSDLTWLQRQYRQRCVAEGTKQINEATQFLFFRDHEVFVGHKAAVDRAAHRVPQLITVAPDQLLDLLPQARRA